MFYAVVFEDEVKGADETRAKHMGSHLEFLERNSVAIKAAGPLKGHDQNAGGLWIVEADSEEQVEKLVHEDPFWPTGLRRSVRILTWRRVFADGNRLL